MWICQQCHAENRDGASVCAACGTPRAAGRFGSSPVQRSAAWTAQPPTVTQPVVRQEQENAPPRTRSAAHEQAPSAPPSRPRRSALSLFARFIGTALLILLPLLTAALAYKQYEPLAPVLSALLTGEAPEKNIQLICYLVFSAAAVLVSALPGLWTLLLSREKENNRR